jgi:hypothetical protein
MGEERRQLALFELEHFPFTVGLLKKFVETNYTYKIRSQNKDLERR